MKRRLAGRDRLAWIVAVLAAGAVLYFFVPLWMLVTAVVVAVGVPLLIRHNRRQRRRARRT
jgi:Flp pilus assembly protein TadB